MKAVLQHISDCQARFAEHRFFDEFRQERPLEQALAFAPRLSFWVMCFQDVLRLNAQRVQDPELAMLMLRHRSEERDHDNWFFEDVATLTGAPLTVHTPWSRAHESTRDASFALVAEVLRPMDDRLRMVLVLGLEATSHVFFTRASNLAKAAAAGSESKLKLKYFSDHHMEAEEQHEVFEEQMEAYLRGIELTPALREEACQMVDRIFAAFEAMFEGMCSEQKVTALRPERRSRPAAQPRAQAAVGA
ncbi:MAG TPA: hypothetical protein VEY88_26255 [Archangium sp.]|jgi:hypothetical protein|nr:hypothetical protein [Archangium sp.]